MPLHAAARRGAVVLGVCGGYQLLGHAYQLGDEELPGIGLLDVRTVRSDGPRLIGNVAIEVELPGAARRGSPGFENHGGRTHLGAGAQPLGRVLSGHGNNGADGHEGARAGNVIGTYLHGPLLPKNAWFADWLIATALGLERRSRALEDDLEQPRPRRRDARRRGCEDDLPVKASGPGGRRLRRACSCRGGRRWPRRLRRGDVELRDTVDPESAAARSTRRRRTVLASSPRRHRR